MTKQNISSPVIEDSRRLEIQDLLVFHIAIDSLRHLLKFQRRSTTQPRTYPSPKKNYKAARFEKQICFDLRQCRVHSWTIEDLHKTFCDDVANKSFFDSCILLSSVIPTEAYRRGSRNNSSTGCIDTYIPQHIRVVAPITASLNRYEKVVVYKTWIIQ